MNLTILSAIALLGVSTSVHAQSNVAQMGDTGISSAELSGVLSTLTENERTQLVRNPQALDQFVRALLIQRFVLAKATAAKHDQDPAVAAKLERTREAAITESYLQSVSEPPADFPSEELLTSTYEENKAALLVPKAWHLAQIFIADPEKSETAESRLATVEKQLAEKGADFASVARVSSDDRTSSPAGGDLGWLQENLIQPAIRDAVADLKLNSVSKPIRLDDGWHIVKLLDTRAATTPTLDQVKPQLTARLRANKSAELRQEMIATMLEKNPAAINEIELRKIKPTP